MIKKSLILAIATLVLLPAMLAIVSAIVDSNSTVNDYSSDTTAPVSNVLEIWDRYGSEKLGSCEEGIPAVGRTFLSFKGIAEDTEHNIDFVELKRDEDIDSVGWNDNSNWDDTSCPDCDNLKSVKFESRATPNSRAFSEGNRTVCSRAKDRKGNLEIISSELENCCSFCVDTDDPEQVKNVAHSNKGKCVENYVNEAPEFEWDAASDDGCAGIDYYEVEVYFSNGELYYADEVNENSITIKEPENGKDYYIEVRAVDRAGNKGEWSSSSEEVYYDNEAPEVDIVSPEAESWFKENFVVKEEDKDNLELWKCEYMIIKNGDKENTRVANGEENENDWIEFECNSDLEIGVPEDCEDGKCKIIKKATDNACNAGEKEITYNIDTQGPTTIKTIGQPKYPGFEWMNWVIDWFVTDKTEVTLTCTDTGIGCNENKTFYRINGEDWHPYNGPFKIGEEDAVYVIEYQSEDLLGNEEEVKSETDKVDTESPTSIKIEEPMYEDDEENVWVNASSEFLIIATDSESGVNETLYRINHEEESVEMVSDNGEWIKYTSPFNLVNECCRENAENFIEYYSIDQLRNEEKIKSQTVMLDCVAPEIKIFNPKENEREIQKCTQSIVAKVDDNGSGVKKVWAELWDDNGNESKKVRTESMTPTIYGTYEALMDKQLPAGDYTLKVLAEDNIGNVNEYLIDESLINSVYVEYISPASCSIEPKEGGECEFTFYVCMRGGDSIKFWLDKLGGIVTPGMMDATILRGNNSGYVGLWDEGIDAGLLSLGNKTINGRESFNLHLNVPADVASQIGTGTHKLDYLIKSFID